MGHATPTTKPAPTKKRKPGQPDLFALMGIVTEREIRRNNETPMGEDTVKRRKNGEPVCYLVS